MPEPSAFRKLTVEAFRGFKDPVEFNLNASAVLITGPNGTGKTSFFDAILWLLTGNLERLKELRAHEKDEWVVNEWSRPGIAVVGADVNIAGTLINLQRSGDRRHSLLEVTSNGQTLRGDKAQRWLDELLIPQGQVPLEKLLLSSGLLQQDVMRWLIEAKPAERYRLLNQLLGLDVLQQVEASTRDFAKRSADEAQEGRQEQERLGDHGVELEAQLGELEARQQLRPSVEDALSAFDLAVTRHGNVVEVTPDSRNWLGSASEILSELRKLRRRIAELVEARELLQVDRSAASPVTEAETVRTRQALSAARETAIARRQELSRASEAVAEAERRTQDLVQLASLAIPLLRDICPVCEQKIDAAHVAHRLQERSTETAALVSIRQARELAEIQLLQANQTLTEAERADQELTRRLAALERLDKRERDWSDQASKLFSTSSQIRLRGLDSAQAVLSAAYTEALADLETFAERLAVALEVSAEQEQIQSIRARIAEVGEQLQTRQHQVEALARREANSEALFKSMQKACMSVGERRAKALGPLVADIFSRLDPHPAFKTLDLAHEMYRAQAATVPMATDVLEGKTVNPALVFSTSQANIAALSIFLALSFGAGQTALPFVLLDDPLQSLDDVNVLAFADLCRFIRDERQLILSTHDRRFGSLLERKLTPRTAEQTTHVIRFKGWDRSGPSVENYSLERQLNVPRLIPA